MCACVRRSASVCVSGLDSPAGVSVRACVGTRASCVRACVWSVMCV